MQLRLRAAFENFRSALAHNRDPKESLRGFVMAAETWQRQHGYENAWSWAEMESALRKLKFAPVEAVLDNQFTLASTPPKGWSSTGYEITHRMLRDTESYTPRPA